MQAAQRAQFFTLVELKLADCTLDRISLSRLGLRLVRVNGQVVELVLLEAGCDAVLRRLKFLFFKELFLVDHSLNDLPLDLLLLDDVSDRVVRQLRFAHALLAVLACDNVWVDHEELALGHMLLNLAHGHLQEAQRALSLLFLAKVGDVRLVLRERDHLLARVANCHISVRIAFLLFAVIV